MKDLKHCEKCNITVQVDSTDFSCPKCGGVIYPELGHSFSPGEAYLCSCGKKFTEKPEFLRHLRYMGKQEPGQHKSLGRVSASGEIVMPPWKDRTPEQKRLSRKKSLDSSDTIETVVTKMLAVPEVQHLAARLISKGLKKLGKYLT